MISSFNFYFFFLTEGDVPGERFPTSRKRFQELQEELEACQLVRDRPVGRRHLGALLQDPHWQRLQRGQEHNWLRPSRRCHSIPTANREAQPCGTPPAALNGDRWRLHAEGDGRQGGETPKGKKDPALHHEGSEDEEPTGLERPGERVP